MSSCRPNALPSALRTVAALCVWGALICPAASLAALINVDFGGNFPPLQTPTYSGGAVLGGAGDQWNAFRGTFVDSAARSGLALADSAGAPTAATLGYMGQSGHFGFPAGCFFGGAAADLMCDYLYAGGSSSPATVTIGGLMAGDLFDLVLYSSGNRDGRQTSFTLDGATQTTTATATADAFVLGTNYARFSGSVGAGGQISFTFFGPGGEGNLNGFQLALSAQAVPEPASLGLVGLALAMLGGIARGRRGADRRG